MTARAARALAVGATLAALTLLATNGLLFSRPLPTTDGYFRLLGLHERVEVVRDALGIPHLYAGDAHDLFFLQGYVTAQDRLAQLEAMRHAARAQVGGRARTATERASVPLRDALEAYAAGITKVVAQYSEARALPPELIAAGDRPAPWEPADSLAVAALYLERIGPSSVCATSAAARSLKGRPLLAADLYLSAPEPGWYEIGIDGGGVRSVGLSIPGVPGIVAGHNGWVAWATLAAARDVSDPAATLGALLAALPSRSARTFGDAMRGSAVASCLADIEGRVGGTDRGRVSFVPAERAGVLSGDARRAADLGARLESARSVDLDVLRGLLGRPALATGGARVIVDLADVDTSRSVVSRGASGLRASAHYGDQAPLWELGQLHRLPLSRVAIARTDGDLVLRAR